MLVMRKFKAGAVHPATWWLLALSLTACATSFTSVLSLTILISAILMIILFARETSPWAQSLGFYLTTGLLVIAIRVIFRVIFNFDSSSDVALNLPTLTLNLGSLGDLELLGRVSFAALASAFRDGLRMAAIILSVALANTLANPRRLLKNTPGALYEVATAVVIAINMAPQLIASAKRVRVARELRGRSRRQNVLSGLLIPVLEDTLESSLALAATMDARGFGRSGTMTVIQKNIARSANLLAISCLAIGSYLLLTEPNLLWPMVSFAFALFGLALAIRINSLRHVKTSYRPAIWHGQDFLILTLAAILVALSMAGALR
jgi:energy-coupling factor transport system permease protein